MLEKCDALAGVIKKIVRNFQLYWSVVDFLGLRNRSVKLKRSELYKMTG